MTDPAERLGGARGDLIVYLATGWWDGPAGTDRQLVEELTAYGPVLYVDPPVSALTRLRKPHHAALSEQPRLQILGPRLARLITYVNPGMTRPVLRRLRAPLVSRALAAAVRRLYGAGPSVAAVISSRVDEAWCTLPARRRLLYMTDDLVAGADMLGLSPRRLARDERVAVRGADAVAVVSPALRDRLADTGVAAELIPNGCAPEMFAAVDDMPRPADVSLPGPIAGFVGYVNERIDLTLLEAVAGTGVSLLVVGGLGDGFRSARFDALVARDNVHWTGPRPRSMMPAYLRLIDVGLTPYSDTTFNRASFPLKTLEYLAAGRSVVATSLPAHTWLGTELITLADRPADFAQAVLTATAEPRTDALAARRRSFAAEHSWRERAADVARLLELKAPVTTRTTGSSMS